MSRTISFRDIMLCTSLANVKNEIELLDVKYDYEVSKILDAIGIDTEYPVSYLPSKHRDMQGKIAVGFMAVGDISLNRSFINSYLCNTTERMIAASYSDPSLTRELGALMGHQVNFRSLLDDEAEFDGEELPEDQLEPDRREVAAQIKALAEIRDQIRGSMYNDAGDLKTFMEYQQ
jgi:hypothetical protein